MQTEAPALTEIEPTKNLLTKWADWLVAGLYVLLTLLITYPLVFQLSTNIRGGGPTGDAYQNLWYMWWYGQALGHGQDPTHTNLMYGLLPNVDVLVSSVLNGLLAWPVVQLFGALTAYNLAMLISFPLAGFFTYKLTELVLGTSQRLAAFAAGFFFTFSTFHFYRLEGHLGLVTVQWLPFYLWRLLALKQRPNLPNALWAGLGLALAALSDLYYLGYFVLPVPVFCSVWWGWQARATFWKWLNMRYYLLAGLLGAVLITPFYGFFLHLDPDVKQAVSDRADDVKNLSADLLAFVLPTSQNPLLGGATASFYGNFKSPFPIEEAVFPGYIVIILAFSTLWVRSLRRSVTFWLSLSLVAFVMALGPQLHINGAAIGPEIWPYKWLYSKLPFLSSFRSPNRFGVIVMLGLAVVAGLALSYWLSRLRQVLKPRGQLLAAGTLVGILLAVQLAQSLTFSWPLQTDPVQTGLVQTGLLYQQIAAEPGDFLVLELPLGTQTRPLYDQILHGKRLVGGVATRISNRMTLSWDQATYLGMFNPAESSAVINNGQVLKAVGGPDIFPLDISFRQMLNEAHIGYVTLRTGRAAFGWMKDYLIQQLGQPQFQETSEGEPLLAWRTLPFTAPVGPPATGTYRIRLGEGWNAGLGLSDSGHLLRLVEQDGQLLVTPGTSGTAKLSLTVTPYIRPQTIELDLNGQLVTKIVTSQPWQPQTATVKLNLTAGPNVLTLHSQEGCLHPIDYIPNSPDQRCISFAVEGVNITQ